MVGVGFLSSETSSILFMSRRRLDIRIVLASISIYLLLLYDINPLTNWYLKMYIYLLLLLLTTAIVVWNWPNTVTILWALWMLMAWYFNTRASVATARSSHPWASCQMRKLRIAHAPGMPETLIPPPRVRDPDMHLGRCVTHVPWLMQGSLNCGFFFTSVAWKRSRLSRRMRNAQFYVSGKRRMRFHLFRG